MQATEDVQPGLGKTVLLTGSRGFTGVYVRAALEEAGYRVVGLVQGAATGDDEVVGDLLEVDGLRTALAAVQPTHVVHLAGIAFVGHSDPLEFYRVNLFGTLNLLEALRDAGVRPEKVVLASSSNVYGAKPGDGRGGPVEETFAPAPVNHYAMSKLAMEQMSQTWLDRMPIVIVRPFNYTGPGQTEKFLVPKIVAHHVRGEARISLGNLHVEREFNDVRTVAFAYRRLLERAPAGTVVNLCTGVGHKLLEVVEQVAALTGHRLEVVVDPKLVRPDEIKVLVGSAARLQAMVPDAPVYSLTETLRAMIARAAG